MLRNISLQAYFFNNHTYPNYLRSFLFQLNNVVSSLFDSPLERGGANIRVTLLLRGVCGDCLPLITPISHSDCVYKMQTFSHSHIQHTPHNVMAKAITALPLSRGEPLNSSSFEIKDNTSRTDMSVHITACQT